MYFSRLSPFVLIASLAAPPLLAQPAALPSALISCAAIAVDADRLACYDRAVIGLSAEARAISEHRAAATARLAAEKARADALAAEERAKTEAEAKRANFGSEGLPAPIRPSDPEAIDEIETTLTEVLVNRAGQNTYLLGNGQLWRQIDGDITYNIRPGEGVRIVRASMGSYRLQFLRAKRFVNVRRLR